MQRLSRSARWATGAAGVVAGAAAAGALVRGGYEVAPELLPPTLVLSLAVGWSFIGVEHDLQDGAQQRLVTVALALRLARTQLGAVPPEELAALLDEAGAELSGALDELRELARGIYPVLLTDAGLGPALVALAERSPVAATVGRVPDRRWPEVVEQTGYFVVSEALAHAAKHADASSVAIDLHPDGDGLWVEVRDDGRGGADPAGSGLRGLADRVAAVGGQFAVDSPPGAGTRVVARLPYG